MKEEHWEKHRVAKLFGHSIFVELSDSLSGAEHNAQIAKVGDFFERAFRNQEFIQRLKDIID